MCFDSLNVLRALALGAALAMAGMASPTQAAHGLLGDLDGDDVFTANDLAKLVGHSSGTAPLPANVQPYADLNKDGFINAADHAELVNLILETTQPEALPPATVAFVTPKNGEGDVAVTRETVVHFTMPLALGAALDTTQFHAKFGTRKILSRVDIASDRKKATLFYLEPLPSNARIEVTLDAPALQDLLGRGMDLDGDGTAGGAYQMSFNTLSITGLAGTGITGTVYASTPGAGGGDVPLANVTVTVDGAEETLRTTTDAQGRFTLTPCPAGSFFVHVDGRTSPASTYPDGNYYPSVGKRWEAVAGRLDNLCGNSQDTTRGTVYLPLIAAGSLQTVSATDTTPVELPAGALGAFPEMAGTRLLVPPNSLFADDGTRGGQVGVAPVAPDRLPSPLPPGLELPMVITIQTDGATNFDVPVPVQLPNLPDPVTGQKLPPGAKSALMSFNHDTGEWEVVGPMTVTEDGNFVKTDAGVGVRQPGWHGSGGGSGGGGPGDPGPGVSGGSGGSGGPGGPEDPGTPPLPPCGPGFREPQNAQEVRMMQGFNSTNAGLGIGGKALQLLGNIPRTLKKMFKFGKGARKSFQEMEKVQLDAQTYERYLDEMAEFYSLYGDGIGPGRPPLPCTPAAPPPPGPGIAAAPPPPPSISSLTPAQALLKQSYTALAEALKEQLAIEMQIEDFYEGKPENYTPTAQEQAMLDGLDAQLNALLGAGGAADRYEPLWQSLRLRLGDVTAQGLGAPRVRESTFYAVVRESDGQVVLRGRGTVSGSVPGLILAPDTAYTLRVFYPSTLAVLESSFRSGPAGSNQTILYPGLPTSPGATVDSDGDELSNLAEAVIGTLPGNADSDADGIPDGAEIRQGSNPLDGLNSATGVIAAVPTQGQALDVAAVNNVVATANGAAGITLFRVQGTSTPTRVADVALPDVCSAVAISGERVAVAAGAAGLVVLDISGLPEVKVVRTLSTSSPITSVAAAGPLAYAGTQDGRVFVVDLRGGALLARIPVEQPLPVHDVAVWRDHLYILMTGKLRTLRLDTLALEGNVPLADQPLAGNRPRLFAAEGTLYAAHTRGFHILDTAASASAPPVVDNLTTGQFGWKQVVPNGSGLALAPVGANSTFDGPHNLDVYTLGEDGREPVISATLPVGGAAMAVAIYNGLGYVAARQGGLQVVNYLPFDTEGEAPAIQLSSNIALDPMAHTGFMESGKPLRLNAAVTDDVQVRNVEFYLDGGLAHVDGNYPFEHRLLSPMVTAQRSNFKVRARVTDTGGNATWTPEYTITLQPDTAAPVVLRGAPQGLTGRVQQIHAYVNEALSAESLTAASFLLREAGPDRDFDTADDVIITPESVAFQPDLQAAVFTVPGTEGLPLGDYRATLTTAVKDLSNNALAAPFSWQFTVEGNVVAWVGAAGGAWGNPANWSSGQVPQTNEVVVINAPAGVDVSLNGQVLNVRSIEALGGARLVADGGFVTLNGVTLKSDLVVESNATVSLRIQGGLRLEAGAHLRLQDGGHPILISMEDPLPQLIGGAGEIVVESGAEVLLSSNFSVLTLGDDLTLRVRGLLRLYGLTGTDVVNRGRILMDAPGAELEASYLVNEGEIEVPTGRVALEYDVDNNGVIELSDTGVVAFGGSFYPLTLAQIGTVQRTGGSFQIAGMLDLGGGVLALNAATGSWELARQGRVVNGSLSTADGVVLGTAPVAPGLAGTQAGLENFTLQAGAAVEVVSGATLTLKDWVNNGQISNDGGAVVLDGVFELDEVGVITSINNGSLRWAGVLDNTGETLMYDNLPQGLKPAPGATIRGGVLSAVGGEIELPEYLFWVWDGVTLNRPLHVAAGMRLQVRKGLTLDNVDILPTGPFFSQVEFVGDQVLGGTGQFRYDELGGVATLLLDVQPDPEVVDALTELTIQPGISLRFGKGGQTRGQASTRVVGKGSVTVTLPGSAVILKGNYHNQGGITLTDGKLLLGDEWTNAGIISVSGAGGLNLGGEFDLADVGQVNRTGGTVNLAGRLLATGGTLALNATTGTWTMGAAGLGGNPEIVGGTVTTAGGAELQLLPGDIATLNGVNFQGTLTGNTGTLFWDGDWDNNGTVTLTDVSVYLRGEFTLADLGVMNRTGGVLEIQGELDNTGGSLLFDLGTPNALRLTVGAIKGGSVGTVGGVPLVLQTGAVPTLRGVTLLSDLHLNTSRLTITGGLNLGGRAVQAVDSQLYFEGNSPFAAAQTVSGGGSITFTGAYARMELAYGTPAPLSLTLGAGLTLTFRTPQSLLLAGNTVGLDHIYNEGLLKVDTAGSVLTIYGNFTNQNGGQATASNGGVIQNSF